MKLIAFIGTLIIYFISVNSLNDNPICKLPKAVGSCDRKMKMYYFNAKTKKCEKFIYSGCDGNDNRFIRLKKCKKECLYDPKKPKPFTKTKKKIGKKPGKNKKDTGKKPGKNKKVTGKKPGKNKKNSRKKRGKNKKDTGKKPGKNKTPPDSYYY